MTAADAVTPAPLALGPADHVLALDVGGTKLAAGVVAATGRFAPGWWSPRTATGAPTT